MKQFLHFFISIIFLNSSIYTAPGFIGGTLIATPEGWCSIEDIAVGEKVLGYGRHNMNVIKSEVVRVGMYQVDSLCQIYNGPDDSIISDEDQDFLVVKDEKFRAYRMPEWQQIEMAQYSSAESLRVGYCLTGIRSPLYDQSPRFGEIEYIRDFDVDRDSPKGWVFFIEVEDFELESNYFVSIQSFTRSGNPQVFVIVHNGAPGYVEAAAGMARGRDFLANSKFGATGGDICRVILGYARQYQNPLVGIAVGAAMGAGVCALSNFIERSNHNDSGQIYCLTKEELARDQQEQDTLSMWYNASNFHKKIKHPNGLIEIDGKYYPRQNDIVDIDGRFYTAKDAENIHKYHKKENLEEERTHGRQDFGLFHHTSEKKKRERERIQKERVQREQDIQRFIDYQIKASYSLRSIAQSINDGSYIHKNTINDQQCKNFNNNNNDNGGNSGSGDQEPDPDDGEDPDPGKKEWEYRDVTKPGSTVKNVETNATREEVEETLREEAIEINYKGGDNDLVEFKMQDGSKQVLRNDAKSTNCPTLDYYKPGNKKTDVKIRLQKAESTIADSSMTFISSAVSNSTNNSGQGCLIL